MTHSKTPEFHLVHGKNDTTSMLNDLMARFERGEIECVAIRLYKSDNSYEDVAIGGDEETQKRALANLHDAYQTGRPFH